MVGDCVPRNECVELVGICPTEVSGGLCIDLVPEDNGYMCSCVDGYAYNAALNFCTPINECLLNPCPTGASCIDLEPSYQCVCDLGYDTNGDLPPSGLLDVDGSCEEFDECDLGVSNCDLDKSVCVNTIGSHFCLCFPAYFMDANNVCQDLDECAADLCPGVSTCTNSDGAYDCQCPEGFTGTMTLNLVALDTVNNEVITATQQSFSCGPKNLCLELVGAGCPVNSECNQIPGLASCLCEPGFEDANAGNNALAPNCVDSDECLGENKLF
jgi:hypothetical protein